MGLRGSGPAQLALAILAWHCDPDEDRTIRLYQEYKWRVVARLPFEAWTITSKQVERVLQNIEQQARLQIERAKQ